jgi:hypothetical protein
VSKKFTIGPDVTSASLIKLLLVDGLRSESSKDKLTKEEKKELYEHYYELIKQGR